jgi:hypothetical protein
MTAVNVPLNIEQGATYTRGLNWYQPGPVVDDVVTPGDPYPLFEDAWTARMQIRQTFGSAVLIEITTETGGIVLSEDGRLDWKFTDLETDLLVVKKAKYDLEVVGPAPDFDVHRLLEGVVNVSPNLTQTP